MGLACWWDLGSVLECPASGPCMVDGWWLLDLVGGWGWMGVGGENGWLAWVWGGVAGLAWDWI